MGGKGKVFLIVWALLATLVAGGLVGFEALRLFGKVNLDSKSATTAPVLEQSAEAASTVSEQEWESDWIRYNGSVYDYNEDILRHEFL